MKRFLMFVAVVRVIKLIRRRFVLSNEELDSLVQAGRR
jgi:hypothetical protein